MIEASISLPLTVFMQLACTAFLAFWCVRGHYRLPAWQIALYTAAFCAAFSAIFSPMTQFGFLSAVAVTICIACAMLFYFRAVNARRGKLLFVLMFAVGYAYLSNALWGVLETLLGRTTPDLTYCGVVLCTLSLLVLLLIYAPVTRLLWLQLCGLSDEISWPLLCLMPATYCGLYFLASNLCNAGVITLLVCNLIEGIITLCALITYPLMFSALNRTAEITRYAERLRQMDDQLTLQKEHMETLATHAEDIRQMRHDMRHHLAVLHQLLAEHRYPQARRYLADYEARMHDAAAPRLCEHDAVDALCRRYIALATRAGLQTDVMLALPQVLFASDGDLAVVLGNLWENAIDAAGGVTPGPGHIRLRAQGGAERIQIQMTNDYAGEILQEGDCFLSTKREGETREGIGVASVRSVAKAYGGEASFTWDASTFTVRVLLYPVL